MSNAAINLSTLTANTVTASTLSQVAYMSDEQLKTYTLPAGFERVTIPSGNFTATSLGFAAVTFVNKATGEVVIAYRGSDTVGEAVDIAVKSASTGSWDPQFTDATNYAVQARAAALVEINNFRSENKQEPLTTNDITPLVTGHSLGGLLGQVVSKMFGWPAEVFDSLGGGKLVYTTDPETGKQVFKAEFAAQAKALGLVDANGNVIDHDVSDKITNYAASSASSVGMQMGSSVDIPALGQVGGMGAVASLLTFLMNPVAGVISLLTSVNLYRDGELIGHTAIQGQATQAQLDKALKLSEQLANATSLGGAGQSDSGESFVDTLNILDAQETAQLEALEQQLSFVDTQYSGSNVASTPVFNTVTANQAVYRQAA
jgi:hypothetical protein